MTRDEWNQVLATEPATPVQRGAVIGEFERLGVTDRAERLALAAELLGLDALGSTSDLVMGDAGRLVGLLRRVRDRAELPEIADRTRDGQDDEPDRLSLVGLLCRLLAALLADTAPAMPTRAETQDRPFRPPTPDADGLTGSAERDGKGKP